MIVRASVGAAQVVLVALAFTPQASVAGSNADSTCPYSAATVVAESAVDKRDACAGAEDAIKFLEKLGLQTSEPPSILVTTKIPPEAGPTAAGCFIEQRRLIYMLPYAQFRKLNTWFGVPIDRRMYRSLATHESAHALAGCNFSVPRPTIQAKEYIAYVAMFSTMDPALRTRALRATPGSGFASEDRITQLLHMFDPMRFGAEAYRHFVKPDVGPAFVKAILQGKALLD